VKNVANAPWRVASIGSQLHASRALNLEPQGPESVRNLLAWATNLLRQAALDLPEREARLLLQHATGLCLSHLLAFPEELVDPDGSEKFRSLVLRRAQRVPAAYLTGKVSFLHWEFFVDESVLVPRPETEILVETVAAALKGRRPGWIVDVGTGSGVIAISLALLLPDFRVLAMDVSPRALRLAEKNVISADCEGRAFLVCGDLLLPLRLKAAAIVANLPYIPTSVLPTLQSEVARYEPREALDGGHDGLRFIAPLVEQAPAYLEDGGLLVLEVAEGQARQVETLMKRQPGIRRTQVFPDYAGIERVVIGFVGD